jgi:hypothetical protein
LSAAGALATRWREVRIEDANLDTFAQKGYLVGRCLARRAHVTLLFCGRFGRGLDGAVLALSYVVNIRHGASEAMRPLYWCQPGPGVWQFEGQAIKFFQVEGAERASRRSAPAWVRCNRTYVMVGAVPGPVHEPCCFGPVHKADDAVVARQKVVGDLTYRRGGLIAMTASGQEQLVLGRGQAGGSGLALAPAFDVAKPSTQGEQTRVSGLDKGILAMM